MKISIVTSTYHNEFDLPLLANSIKSQSVAPFEWIIADDGSMDNTWGVAYNLMQKSGLNIDGVMQLKKGSRYTTNLNNGLRKVKGDVILVVNGDSYLEPNALENLSKSYVKGSCGTGIRINRTEDKEFHSFDWRVPDGNEEVKHIRPRNKFYSYFTLNGAILNPKALEEVNYLDERYSGYGRDDWDLFLRLGRNGTPLYQYNNVRLNVTFKEPKPDNLENVKLFETLLHENN